jgi:hypothetical protein
MKDKSQVLYIVGTVLQMFTCEVYVPGDALFKITLSIPDRCSETDCDVLCHIFPLLPSSFRH